MITFGYKNKFTGPLRALTAIAIGIVMVACKTNALELAVRIIAAFVMASGIVSMIVGYRNRSNGTMGLLGFNAVVDLILGVLLFIYPGVAAGLLIYLIAFVLICFGFFLISKPAFLGEAIGVVAGVSLIIYGASELVSSWRMRKVVDDHVADPENDVEEQ